MTVSGDTPRSADPLTVHPALPAGRAGVVIAAPAKLNLFLEILRKRPDGFHDLESLMVAVELFDTLEIRAVDGSEIALSCEPASLSTGPDNLVHKAAVALRTHVNRPEDRRGFGGPRGGFPHQLGAEISLTKRIPTQAGLGGGS